MTRLVKRVWAVAPVVAQAVGGAAAVSGAVMLMGLWWTLLVGGLAVAAVGTLAEMRGR